MSARTVLVTGTDTEIGKTFVSVRLMRALAHRGLRVSGMKPVASGCVRTRQGLRSDDALDLMAAANVPMPYEQVNPYAFEPAIAPHIAAQESGVRIDPADICRRHRCLSERSDWVVVEGVGGWQVPLDGNFTVADLAEVLGARVILVVGIRLGCINHALLSVESIVRKKVRMTGWVANLCEASGERENENIDTLTRLIHFPRIAVVPNLAASATESSVVENEFDLGVLGIQTRTCSH